MTRAATRKEATQQFRTAQMIRGYLALLPKEASKVATQVLKQALDLGGLPRMSFTHALRDVVDGNLEWQLVGRSLVRVAKIYAPWTV